VSVQSWLADVTGEIPPISPDEAAFAESRIRDISSVSVNAAPTIAVRSALAVLDSTAGTGEAVLWGRPGAVDPISAAFGNGTAAQAIEYDDIAPGSTSHVNAILIPAIAALVSQLGPGQALPAYILGLRVVRHFEVTAPVFHRMYSRGLQPTHLMGPLAAVSALAAGLGLSRTQRYHAIGLAATQLLGVRAHSGSSGKAFQAGFASAAAVRAALIARAGGDGGHEALDTVLKVVGMSDEDLSAIAGQGLGGPAPIAPRLYPTNGAAHTAIEATLTMRSALLGEREDGPDDVRITVQTPPRALNALSFNRPASPDEARFSMPFAVATAWQLGRVKPADFTPERIGSDALRALLDRVELVPVPGMEPPPDWSGNPAIVTVEYGGRKEELAINVPIGYPDRPLSEATFQQKFVECAGPVLGAAAADAFARIHGADSFVLANKAFQLQGGAR
jgi:2-methylcitrate dehydratase PrpD